MLLMVPLKNPAEALIDDPRYYVDAALTLLGRTRELWVTAAHRDIRNRDQNPISESNLKGNPLFRRSGGILYRFACSVKRTNIAIGANDYIQTRALIRDREDAQTTSPSDEGNAM